MSDKHTKGRLHVCSHSINVIRGGDGKWVADIRSVHRPNEEDQANARRLAACWNACDGFDTDLLLNIDMMGDTLKQRFEGMQNEVRRVYACESANRQELAVASAQIAARDAEIADLRAALAAKSVPDGWQPIETAPKDGYMLVHEDGAIRALMRVNGEWKQTAYPAIISLPFGDVIVGEGANRMLPTGYKLAIRDGCCENPTHWMQIPAAPSPLEPSHE